ncbi:DUF4230 domain-containing protein [Olsenella umbonata]|uniref:DUF4230 domain-containing protein n=1 Tax=Parafannyhessea umbonata TaxID=604330 RepID=A0A7X9XZA5_9ACTN|nr:DUF4230 domain-containing protein [Parafannyhessea umbonata]NMF25196.1 DUF4230 domain-containing protein [Parafannyhessea umbonata]
MEQDTEDLPVDESPGEHYVEQHSEARSTLKAKRMRFRNIVNTIRSNKVLFLVVAIVLVVLGANVGYRIGAAINTSKSQESSREARNERVFTVDAVFEQIRAQNTLVCASQQYDLYQKVETSNRDLLDKFNLPFTRNRYYLRYVGTIQAGVDLKTATIVRKDVDKSGKPQSVVVELDAPKIISNTPDMDKTDIYDEENNIFNPIDPKSVVELEKTCKEESDKNAVKGGLIDQAKVFAQQNIQTMLRGTFGSKVKVKINWRS